MEFPSLQFVESLQKTLNKSEKFSIVSRWSDVKILLCFGERRYWLKLYGGKVIDYMEYFPMANPLGWDYMISAPLEKWEALRKGKRHIGHFLDTGDISIDGDLLQANRLYESNQLMLLTIRDL
tara:strand:- start:86 stop:454 length:369 start_codon:yes stop_codon:yes gene_type:complete